VLAKEGGRVYKVEPSNDQSKFPQLTPDSAFPSFPTAYVARFSPFSGKQLAVVDEIGIQFINASTGKVEHMIAKHNGTCNSISTIEYSPRDTYLITCEKHVQGENNLIVWNSQTGKEVAGFAFKKGSKEGPKSIKFTADERYCARLTSKTGIDIFDLASKDDSAFEKPKFKLQANVQLLGRLSKKEASGYLKEEYKFDGFDFVPVNPDIPAQFAPRFFVCWKNSESLTDRQDGSGILYIFDMNASMDKFKF
jgi:WD40 repeat protein